jgi:hypothetical protein
MKLIFIHGREQENKDETFLELTWLNALREGLQKIGKTLPNNVTIEFPYYADVMQEFVDNPTKIPPSTKRSSKMLVVDEDEFAFDFLTQLLENTGQELPKKRGIKNSIGVHALLKLIETYTNWSEPILKRKFQDLHLYLTHSGVQEAINKLVLSKFDKEPCVVVGHSLGSVLSYVMLKSHDELTVNKLITLGSPLGIPSINELLPKPLGMPECLKNGWFNAYDKRDIVALNPLDAEYFPIDGTIEAKSDVDNQTDNRHGIVGYLNDKDVAAQIYNALGLND